MLKNFNYSLIALFFLTIFSACEKEADQASPLSANLTQNAIETSLGDNNMFITLSDNNVCEGVRVILTAGKDARNQGTFIVYKTNGDITEDITTAATHVNGYDATEDPTGTKYQAKFYPASQGQTKQTGVLTRVISTTGCDFECNFHVAATATGEIAYSADGKTGYNDITFIVEVCEDMTDFRVQGGLAKDAKIEEVLQNTGNWTQGNAKNGQSITFSSPGVSPGVYTIVVRVSRPTSKLSDGKFIGAWSATGKVAGVSVKSVYSEPL